jgi:hypothetical protein
MRRDLDRVSTLSFSKPKTRPVGLDYYFDMIKMIANLQIHTNTKSDARTRSLTSTMQLQSSASSEFVDDILDIRPAVAIA